MRLERPDGLDLSNWRSPPYSRWSFQHVPEVIPAAAVTGLAGRKPESLSHLDLGQFGSIEVPPQYRSLSDLLRSTYTDGLLVSQHGVPVGGWFAPHFNPSNPHLLFSVSKSITGLVAGILTDRGLLDPAAPVSEYLPIPEDCAYFDCTVQQVLDMSVSLAFEEDYTVGASDYARYREASGWNPVDQTGSPDGLRSFIFSLKRSPDEHGRIFRYRSPNSDLLGMIASSAGGKPFPDLMTDLLWQPMGARTDACITVDHYQESRTAGGICTTIDDLSRIGQLICNQGANREGIRILSDAWIRDTLENGNRQAWLKGDFSHIFPEGNYRNQWYCPGGADQSLFAMGIHGQYLYANPKRDLVIVRLASQALPVDEPVEQTIIHAMKAIATRFS